MRIYALALVLVASGYHPAANSTDTWDSTDKALLTGLYVSSAVDWLQTRYIVGSDRYYETNPILGTHPSNSEVAQYFIGRAFIHYAVADVLPSDWRKLYLFIELGSSVSTVHKNYQLGIGVRW